MALLGGMRGHLLNQSERTQPVLNKVAGTVFLGLAWKLATTEKAAGITSTMAAYFVCFKRKYIERNGHNAYPYCGLFFDYGGLSL